MAAKEELRNLLRKTFSSEFDFETNRIALLEKSNTTNQFPSIYRKKHNDNFFLDQ